MSSNQFNVLIVGCGNIAGGFDMAASDVEFVRTHAGAYKGNEDKFNLLACVEPNEDKRCSFMKHWGITKGFSTLEEALDSNLAIDVVSICSPTAFHFNDVLLSIKLKPKLIFCEKPVASSSEEAKLLVDSCEQAGILLAVNYTRRWDPEIKKLKERLGSKFYGELRSIVGSYNKGILNNGSHLIDLLHYLLGDLEVVAAIESRNDADPTIPALLRSESGIPIHLAVGKAEDYALFELQLICANGSLIMRDGGMSWEHRESINSKSFAGYRTLGNSNAYSGGYKEAMTRAITNIYLALTSNELIASDGNSAVKAQKVCERIYNYAKGR